MSTGFVIVALLVYIVLVILFKLAHAFIIYLVSDDTNFKELFNKDLENYLDHAFYTLSFVLLLGAAIYGSLWMLGIS